MKILLRIAFHLIVAALLTAPLAAQPLSRSVLLIDQSSAGLPFNTALATAIRLTLNAAKPVPISFYAEHLDANRFFGSDYEEGILSFFRKKYRDKALDVVVVVGSAALDFIIRRRPELWPNVPVVFAAIDEATIARMTLPPNVTGVTMQLTLQDMVRVATTVVPDLKRIATVGDPLERQTFYRHFQDEIPSIAAQLEIIDLMNFSMGELKRRLGNLPDATAVIYTGIYYDSEGVSHVPAELVAQIAEWANRPVVINVASYLGKGAVGGYIVRPEPIGQLAAQLALRILNGDNASDVPVTKVPSSLIFEWPALQRWGISESRLPPGSEIHFRIPTVWDQYRGYILAIIAAILSQAALISWLIYEHWRRQVAEADSLQRINELARMNRFATAGELSASLAHEIRQPLAAIQTFGNAGLNWLKRQVPDLDEVRNMLQNVVKESHRADDIIKSIRAMFRNESPVRTQINLNELIRQVIAITAGSRNSNTIVLNMNLTGDPPPLVMADPVQLQQVILNLVMNAVEAMNQPGHRTRRLRLGTQVRPDGTVLMKVTDSGPSVDPEVAEKMFQPFFTTKPSGMGMGLAICKTIIEAHGGSLTASPGNPHGMEFQIVLSHYN